MGLNSSLPVLDGHDNTIFADDQQRAYFLRPYIHQTTIDTSQIRQLLDILDPSFASLKSHQKSNSSRTVCHYLQSEHGLSWSKVIRTNVDSNAAGVISDAAAENPSDASAVSGSSTGQKRRAGSDLNATRQKRLALDLENTSRPTSTPPTIMRSSSPALSIDSTAGGSLMLNSQASRRLPWTGVVETLTQIFNPIQGGPAVDGDDSNDLDYQYGSQARNLFSLQKVMSHKKYKHEYLELKRLRDSPKTTWIIDCEFVSLSKYNCAVPLEISIRTLDRESIINTRVNYNMSTWELYTQLVPSLSPSTEIPVGTTLTICNRVIKKHYGAIGNSPTHGKTISQTRHEILEKGFNTATHKVLCWGGGVDRTIFNRIMAGDDRPVVPLAKNVLSSDINVANIIKTALPSKFDPGFGLEALHTEVCGGIVRDYHRADEDVQAMIDVIEVFLDVDANA